MYPLVILERIAQNDQRGLTRRVKILYAEDNQTQAEIIKDFLDLGLPAAELDHVETLAEAKAKAQGIANETREAIQADLSAKRAAAEADLAAKVSSAEASIAKTKAEALTHVDEIAAETAQAVVSQIVGDVPADSVRAAVAKVKG